MSAPTEIRVPVKTESGCDFISFRLNKKDEICMFDGDYLVLKLPYEGWQQIVDRFKELERKPEIPVEEKKVEGSLIGLLGD